MSTFQDREILAAAHEKGFVSTVLAFFRLSGPGWLQSAITLGGGSLIGSLYLGMLGGTEMLWLQLVAIVIGVIMLAAISYITLSTHQRPYEAINDHVNPVLGVGWLTATVLANMIWILSQFSLCYDALDKNLIPGGLGDSTMAKAIVSAALAIVALSIVIMSFKPGWASRVFGWLLKTVIILVLACFVGVVVWLARDGSVNWVEVLWGFVPDFSLWTQPSTPIAELVSNVGDSKEYWQQQIVERQRESMISVTATAVGLNMTFLLPYSMLARGWDKPFRGLARFDLIVGLAIPFLVVTTCIVIASAFAFHGKADANLLSNDPSVIRQSVLFDGLAPVIEKRFYDQPIDSRFNDLNAEIAILQRESSSKVDREQNAAAKQMLVEAKARKLDLISEYFSTFDVNERKLAAAMVKPDVAQLSAALAPIFGENNNWAKILLGLGALGMGFSTIIILSLTNSLAVAEMYGNFENYWARIVGAAAALIVGSLWFLIWSSGSKTYLVIAASTFGAILLPIAYIAFFALMNNKRLLGDEKPVGYRLWIWNGLMGVGVIGAIAQAYGGITTKLDDPVAGPIVIGGAVTFLLLALVGFSARPVYDYGDEPDE